MKHLLIMRHAKSSWDQPNLSDYERPLNERGQIAALKMGSFLKELNILPQAILYSTAQRTTETMSLFVEASQFQGTLLPKDDLYASSAESYLSIIRNYKEDHETIIIIGHNPSCENLCRMLCGSETFFPTAAIGHLALPIDHWQDLDSNTKGILKNIWRPKDLDP